MPETARPLPPPILCDAKTTGALLGISERHVRELDKHRLMPEPILLGGVRFDGTPSTRPAKRWVYVELLEWAAIGRGCDRDTWNRMKSQPQRAAG